MIKATAKGKKALRLSINLDDIAVFDTCRAVTEAGRIRLLYDIFTELETPVIQSSTAEVDLGVASTAVINMSML
jgi:hypothetical protein